MEQELNLQNMDIYYKSNHHQRQRKKVVYQSSGVSTDNKKLKDDYIDTKDGRTPYNAAENETERPTVIVKDGVKYELVEIKGNPRGKSSRRNYSGYLCL